MPATKEETKDSLLFRSGDPDFMTSLARGLEVLRAFSQSEGQLTTVQICKMTGLSRAVVRRCLYTLSEAGYVVSGKSGFRLKAKVLSLSQPYYLASDSLPALAQPLMERVSEETGECCGLGILEGSDVVYVARTAPRRLPAASLTVGSRLPAPYTSLGRVLLSQLTEEELEDALERFAFTRHTQLSIVSPGDLARAIDQARQRGSAIVDQELETGVRAVAVPVLDPNTGQCIAAMNVCVEAGRVTVDDLQHRIMPRLRTATMQLTESLAD